MKFIYQYKYITFWNWIPPFRKSSEVMTFTMTIAREWRRKRLAKATRVHLALSPVYRL